MATRKVKLNGVATWAKVFEENRDMQGFEGAYADHDGACTIDLILSDEEFAKLKAAGSIKKGSKTDDGDTKVKLTRKFKDRFEWASGAPTVTQSDGTPWTYGTEGIIPNNSIVEVDVVVYDTSRPSIKGTRLEAVKVLHLAEMEDQPSDDASSEFTFSEEIPF